jgi:hypothetical protein
MALIVASGQRERRGEMLAWMRVPPLVPNSSPAPSRGDRPVRRGAPIAGTRSSSSTRSRLGRCDRSCSTRNGLAPELEDLSDGARGAD